MNSSDPLASALRALGVRLVHLAERLECASSRALPWEPLVAHQSTHDERLLELRHRIYTRYY